MAGESENQLSTLRDAYTVPILPKRKKAISHIVEVFKNVTGFIKPTFLSLSPFLTETGE